MAQYSTNKNNNQNYKKKEFQCSSLIFFKFHQLNAENATGNFIKSVQINQSELESQLAIRSRFTCNDRPSNREPLKSSTKHKKSIQSSRHKNI